jgi:hypothetical protein
MASMQDVINRFVASLGYGVCYPSWSRSSDKHPLAQAIGCLENLNPKLGPH